MGLESFLHLMLYLHQFLTSFVPKLPQESSDTVLNNLFADNRQNMARTLQTWFEISGFPENQSSGNTECDSGNTGRLGRTGHDDTHLVCLVIKRMVLKTVQP